MPESRGLGDVYKRQHTHTHTHMQTHSDSSRTFICIYKSFLETTARLHTQALHTEFKTTVLLDQQSAFARYKGKIAGRDMFIKDGHNL